MKKRYVYFSLLLMFVLALVVIRLNKSNHKKETVYSELFPRKASLAYPAEWAMVKNNAEVLLQKIRNDPDDIKSLMALSALYLQEARITGNFNYYNDAALRNIDRVLSKDSKNFEALTFKATILISQHQFEEAYQVAEQTRKLYPYNAYVYGLLVDANIELGNYKNALEAADKMVSIRPDARSYSRIAYLREIHGDIPGAIEAMKMAVDAGAIGDENTEWCRVQLAKLYEQLGKIKDAAMHFTIAAENRSDYPYSIAGLAGIAVAEKDYKKALSLYEQAVSIMPDHLFKEGIAEVYTLMGQNDKAKEMANEILEKMKQLSAKSGNGQNEDHEMAHAYMGVNNYEKALEYALKEYNRRPDNIEVNETVAIVYYRKGDFAKALPYIEAAMKTNSKNPEILCQAGLIYAEAGDKKKAKIFLKEALKNNPRIPMSLKNETENMLKLLS